MIDGQKRGFMQFQDIRAFLDSILDEDIHTKRVDSLANATLGVMTGASLGVAIIGKSLAQARGLLPKHAIKQVDRLLSNRKLEAWDLFATWVPELVGSRPDLTVAGPTSTPTGTWRSSWSRPGDAAGLAQRAQGRAARNDYEDACLRRLAEVLPAGVRVTLLAGFADTKLFDFLGELGFGYVIRLKGNTRVGVADGTTRPRARAAGRASCAMPPRHNALSACACTPSA